LWIVREDHFGQFPADGINGNACKQSGSSADVGEIGLIQSDGESITERSCGGVVAIPAFVELEGQEVSA
jgi:hypothetical protein